MTVVTKKSFANGEVKKKKKIWFMALLFVVLVWGITPINVNYALEYASAQAYATASGIISFVSLLIINAKKLKLLNAKYFKVAVPTGIILALAELVQKIALPFTTPATYAFLENLSCVVIPITYFVLTREKPSIFKVIGAVLALIGMAIFSGINFTTGEFSFGLGEILCALAGMGFGINIATTGAFAKELDAGLYVMIQMGIYAVVGVASALIMSMPVFGGSLAENFRFCFEPWFLAWVIGATLIVSTLCWILRTNCMKYIDATVVGIVMPFSAVITGVCSVILGTDSLTPNLLIGGITVLAAVLISGVEKKKNKEVKEPNKNLENGKEKV